MSCYLKINGITLDQQQQMEQSQGYRRSGSSMSQNSASSAKKQIQDNKRDLQKQRNEARRLKMEEQLAGVVIGQEIVIPAAQSPYGSPDLQSGSQIPLNSALVSNNNPLNPMDAPFQGGSTMGDGSSLDNRGGGSLLYGKSTSIQNRSPGVLFGKSSSLIFPTGVEPPPDTHSDNIINLRRHKINLLLDQCETVRFPFKKKLVLDDLNLTADDIPVKDLYKTSLGNSLHKLSLAGNQLWNIPPKLVTCLPVLKTLDLSQCELHQLPERWNLPQLRRLNLSHNRLSDFPEEVSATLRKKI